MQSSNTIAILLLNPQKIKKPNFSIIITYIHN